MKFAPVRYALSVLAAVVLIGMASHIAAGQCVFNGCCDILAGQTTVTPGQTATITIRGGANPVSSCSPYRLGAMRGTITASGAAATLPGNVLSNLASLGFLGANVGSVGTVMANPLRIVGQDCTRACNQGGPGALFGACPPPSQADNIYRFNFTVPLCARAGTQYTFTYTGQAFWIDTWQDMGGGLFCPVLSQGVSFSGCPITITVGNPSQDCNGNGIEDACDISGGASGDCNANGIPDDCEVSCGWELVSTTGPSPRQGHAMAYFASRNVTVLFGGHNGTSPLADTWEWDGASWTDRSGPVGPSARNGHRMVYDPDRDVVLLFGGFTTALNDETWQWDGAAWTLLDPTPRPGVRASGGFAYDAARRVAVLYGGSAPTGRYPDTWEWNGMGWTQRLATSPPGFRSGHSMTYDDQQAWSFMFGGITPGNIFNNDAWTWDGASWQNRGAGGPSPRGNYAMTYDPNADRVLLHGGVGGGSALNGETWAYDAPSNTWNQIFEAGPSPRQVHQMVFDSRRGRVVLFGGLTANGVNGETWERGCPDCNANGAPDWCDIATGVSADLNGNGVPDECEQSCVCDKTPAYESPPQAPPAAPCACEGQNATEDPVNLFSGEFTHSAVDLVIPGRGLDFVWARKYRSRYGFDTAMGNGWDFSYNVYIEPQGPDFILHDGNARADLYSQQPDGTWTAPEFFRALNQNPDASYTLTFSDTGKWRFFDLSHPTAPGKLAAMEDRNGNTMTFDYDGLGRLTTIHDTLDTVSHNRDVQIAYDVNGRITSVTDWTGRQVTYAYYVAGDPGGSAGDLRSATSPAVIGTPTGNDFPGGKTTMYTYSQGFVDECLNHNLLSVTDPKGQTFLSVVYETQSDPLGILCDRVKRLTWGDPDDNIDIVYLLIMPDPTNNFAVIKAIVNNRKGYVQEYFYDQFHRLTMQREYTGQADPDQPTTETVNRPTGQLRAGDPPYFETQYDWNVDARLAQVLMPNGNSIDRVYEFDLNPTAPWRARGNLREEHRIPGVLGGDQAQIDEYFEYAGGFGGCCNANFVTRRVDGRGNQTLHTYDAFGNRVHTQHRIPSIVEDWEYNAYGQVTAHVLPDNGNGQRRRDEFTYYTQADGAPYGYLESEIVDAGNFALTTTYEYDAVGNITRDIDPLGHDKLYVVNALNQVVREESPEVISGSGVRFWKETYYDANDNIVREDVQNRAGPGTPSCNVDPANPYFTAVYEYEILNNMTRMCQESGSYNGPIPGTVNMPTCAGLPDSQFVSTGYEYDDNRNLSVTRFGEAVEGRQPGNGEVQVWDERDILYQTIQGSTTALRGANASTTQFDYDGNRNLKAKRVGLESGERLHQYVYDGFDRLRFYADPMGNETQYVYDGNGNMTVLCVRGEPVDRPPPQPPIPPGQSKQPILYKSTHCYDEENRTTCSIVDHVDCNGQPIGDGQSITQYFYSGTGHLIRVIDDNGRQTSYTLDSANRKTIEVDAKGNEVRYVYDADSDVLTMTSIEESDLGASDETFVTANAYDGLDRLTTTTDAAGNVTRYGYDSRNNRIEQIDALGNAICESYDGLKRLISTTRLLTDNGAGSGTVVGSITTTKTWDDTSRMTSETDDNGSATTFVYDALNRKIQTIFGDATIESLTYDAHDNVISMTDANGSVVSSNFDLNNRLSSRAVAVGPGVSNATTSESYQYDGRSRTVQGTDNDSTVIRCWDSLSNIVEEQITYASVTRTVRSTFDGVGNQLTCQYPGGRLVTCAYEELNRKRTISDQAGGVAAYNYIGKDRVERKDFANGTRCDYTYDGVVNPPGDFGVKHAVRTRHYNVGTGTVIDDREYRWDAMYNKTRREDIRVGGPRLTHDYAYDSAYRLTRTTVADPSPATLRDTMYELDGVGNRTRVIGTPDPGIYALSASTPNPADLQTNQYTETPFDRRQYDLNGNLTRIFGYGDCDLDGDIDLADFACLSGCFAGPQVPATAACRAFDFDQDTDVDLVDVSRFQTAFASALPRRPGIRIMYDYRNQMVEYFEIAPNRNNAYAYDVYGRRLARVVDADGATPQETRYHYFDRRVVEERDAGGSVVATYIYGNYIDDIVNMRRGGADYYYHTDDLYNVMSVTDAAGQVAERYDYQDYGVPEFYAPGGAPLTQSAVGNPLLYSGRRYDSESGWHYYRTRYLDPRAGRFTTRDTVGIWEDASNLGNGYTYVGNNPWSHVDPMGTYKTPKFKHCSSAQESIVKEAMGFAETIADQAYHHLNNLATSQRPCDLRYKEWFGAYKKSRYNKVCHKFKKIDNAISNKKITFKCNCTDNAYAWVFPGFGKKIHLCNLFWTAPANGTDSRAGTIVHEISHEVAGTGDKAYGHSAARQLAIDHPGKAKRNADSYEYFAENNPVITGSSSGCSGGGNNSGVERLPYAVPPIVAILLWARWRRRPAGDCERG